MALMNHYLVIGPTRTRFRLPDSETRPDVADQLSANSETPVQIEVFTEDDAITSLYVNLAAAPWWYLESHPAG